jgi:hypothetical protein
VLDLERRGGTALGTDFIWLSGSPSKQETLAADCGRFLFAVELGKGKSKE